MTDWLTIVGSGVVSTALTYALTSSRVMREYTAKIRVEERYQFAIAMSRFIAEAEIIRRPVGSLTAPEKNVIEETYQAYVECSSLVEQTRHLGAWERFLIRDFCARAFGWPVYQLARLVPHSQTQPSPLDLAEYTIVSGEDSYKAKYSEAELFFAIFADETSPIVDTQVRNGAVIWMRQNKRELDKSGGRDREELLGKCRTSATEVLKLSKRVQYLKSWRMLPTVVCYAISGPGRKFTRTDRKIVRIMRETGELPS